VMLKLGFQLARPLLFALPPEPAHEVSLRALEAGLYPRAPALDDPSLAVELWGLKFPNPLGIAAGYDKDARVPDAVLGLGCGFAEIGTVTPEPQPGNARPRVFRLPADRAVINRLGFNSGGHVAALARLRARHARGASGIVGVNLGANKETADRTADYVSGIATFGAVASYFAVNISSPNTPGLRDLQAPAALDALLSRVMAARDGLPRSGGRAIPVVVKIAPDIAADDLAPIVARMLAHNVDGIAVSNTTLTRPGLADRRTAEEAGGLSGRPLFKRSTVMLARVFALTAGKVPLIGIGGIDSPETALAKIEAGASLIQLYTGLIFEGPALIGRIKTGLATAASTTGVASIAALVGRQAKEWADMPLDA
jgi:dihydroorotate dehydrogenase